jgi:hypothetical protein
VHKHAEKFFETVNLKTVEPAANNKKATRRWLFYSAKTDYLAAEAAGAAAEAASDAAGAGAAAGAAAGAGASAFLPQATKATAANNTASTRDFFILNSLNEQIEMETISGNCRRRKTLRLTKGARALSISQRL